MANAFKHKRYFRVCGSTDSSAVTFSDTDDAVTKIGFRSEWNTSSPTITYALADGDKTLVATYEFDSNDEQSAWKTAVDSNWSASGDGTKHWNTGTQPWTGDDSTQRVEHFKTEWLNEDGSVSSTSYPPLGINTLTPDE